MRFLIAENLTMYVTGNQSIIWEELDTHGWGKAVSGERAAEILETAATGCHDGRRGYWLLGIYCGPHFADICLRVDRKKSATPFFTETPSSDENIYHLSEATAARYLLSDNFERIERLDVLNDAKRAYRGGKKLCFVCDDWGNVDRAYRAQDGENEDDFIDRVVRENIEFHYSAFESVEVR